MQLRNRSLADETDMWDEEEALIDQEKEEEQEGSSRDEDTKKGIAGDERNILVLLFLYVLQVCQKFLFSLNALHNVQGIPLGLAAAIPLILTNRNVSYKQQGEFSFAFWPFSVKLLWAPLGRFVIIFPGVLH